MDGNININGTHISFLLDYLGPARFTREEAEELLKHFTWTNRTWMRQLLVENGNRPTSAESGRAGSINRILKKSSPFQGKNYKLVGSRNDYQLWEVAGEMRRNAPSLVSIDWDTLVTHEDWGAVLPATTLTKGAKLLQLIRRAGAEGLPAYDPDRWEYLISKVEFKDTIASLRRARLPYTIGDIVARQQSTSPEARIGLVHATYEKE